MAETVALTQEEHAEIEHEIYSKTVFGFWVYILTDCILFGILFATYAVLHPNTFGGPSGKELFDPPFVLAETLILLTSSFTCGLSRLAAHAHQKKKMIAWMALTFILGASFVVLELTEFTKFVEEGNSWRRSGFLSSFFTLVGTHGAHVSLGLLWMSVVTLQIYFRGFTHNTLRRLSCLGMFWHFLDVVWIFIFTFVYMMGVMA